MNSIEWTAERKLFKAVTETTSLIAWATEPSGSCFYLSPEWYSFTGMTRDEPKAFGWLSYVHPDDIVRVRQSFFSANDTRTAFGETYRLAHADGHYVPVWDVGLPKFADDGSFHGFFGTTCVILPEYFPAAPLAEPVQPSRLTPREREILRLVADGNTSDTVSAVLGISERTVNTHLANAGHKLKAFNRVHTVAVALRLSEI
ncbi:MAG: hypothetical protein ABS75_09450 [Pelagibacterium sp. SCN 63-23]|nr:MAG: hypothetical protein ABS75_09450 [Pelagibacterium sp. SCN 63-23]